MSDIERKSYNESKRVGIRSTDGELKNCRYFDLLIFFVIFLLKVVPLSLVTWLEVGGAIVLLFTPCLLSLTKSFCGWSCKVYKEPQASANQKPCRSNVSLCSPGSNTTKLAVSPVY